MDDETFANVLSSFQEFNTCSEDRLDNLYLDETDSQRNAIYRDSIVDNIDVQVEEEEDEEYDIVSDDDFISDDELEKAKEDALEQKFNKYDELDLENNLLRLYSKIYQPYVAINDQYTWYISNNPKKLPKDCDLLHYPSTEDPNEQFGMAYILDQTVVDAQGRTQRKVKIGFTNSLRRRLMELQRSIMRHNINKENSRVMVLFTCPHRNPAKTEKLLHKHFARVRHGTQEVFSISLAEAYIQLPTPIPLQDIQTLPADLIPYSTTTLDNNLKLMHYEQDPRSRVLGIFQDILLKYPADFIMNKYQLTQNDLLRIINSDDYREVSEEYRDLYTIEGMTRFKADVLKLQLLDKSIDMIDKHDITTSDILKLAQMHKELTKDMVVVNNRLRKSTYNPAQSRIKNINDVEQLPIIEIGSYGED